MIGDSPNQTAGDGCCFFRKLKTPLASWRKIVFFGLPKECPPTLNVMRNPMSKRVQIILLGLVCFLLGCLVAQQLPFAQAQDKQVKKPQWLHGLSVKVRLAAEDGFTDKTKKVGIEVFRDENNGNLIYITE